MRSAIGVAIGALCFSLVPARAQEPNLDDLLVRFAKYLTGYETDLSTVIAEEHYEQDEVGGARPRMMPDGVAVTGGRSAMHRVLLSDVAFLRLPGNAEWFGVRDVKAVDGKPVTPGGSQRLLDILMKSGPSRLNEATAIVAASAQYNLGSLRTINMPTVPLELLREANHVRFEFTLRGKDTVSGTKVRRVDFREFEQPTLITGVKNEPLFSYGSVWVEPESGRLWRVELVVGPDHRDVFARQLFQTKMRVDFMLEPKLNVLVPRELNEDFYSRGGRAKGRARYSNFRRFTTSARIVPN